MGIDTPHPRRHARAAVGRTRSDGGILRNVLLCAALCFAGCAVVPLPPLPQDTPPTWQNAPAGATRPAPDLRGWWQAFGDAELDRLIEAALAQNLTIRQAALRVDGARALARKTNAAFLPQLGIHTFAEPTPDSSASYFQMGFDAKWELGLFGRATGHARVLAADLRIAQSDTQAARVSVIAEVARTYIELRGAQQRVALLEQLRASANDRTALVETRVRLRMASANDLARAQADQATAEAALSEPRLAIERSRRQLALLLGQSQPGADFVAAGPPPVLGDLRIAGAPADLVRTRPEIRHAENDVLKAVGELGLARADLFPRLGLGGSLTYSAKVIGTTRLSDADGIVTLGPAIDIPLFDWGARRAVVRARDAALSASLLAYRQAVLEGVAEAEIAMATLEQQREQAAALGRGLASLERADAAIATLRRLGLADGLERAAASAAVLQAKLEHAQAEQARSIAFIALYKALGGAPLPPGEAAPDSAASAARQGHG